jgi:hypothetical protein
MNTNMPNESQNKCWVKAFRHILFRSECTQYPLQKRPDPKGSFHLQLARRTGRFELVYF